MDRKISLMYKKFIFFLFESFVYDLIKGNFLIVGGVFGSSNLSVYNKFINFVGGK